MADKKDSPSRESDLLEAALQALKQAQETNERLAQMLTAPPKAPVPEHQQTLDEVVRKRLSEMRGDGLKGPEITIVKGCRSVITGSGDRVATFDAKVLGDDGPVLDLLNYTRPPGWDKPQAQGGFVPDGMERFEYVQSTEGEAPVRREYPAFKQWAYATFWKADLLFYVGKPLPKHSDPRVVGPAVSSDKAAE